MYKDILFSLTSDTKIGGKNLRPGTYKLVYRSKQLFIWDARNIAVASIAEQTEFDELVLDLSVQTIKTIYSDKYTITNDQQYDYTYGSGWNVGSGVGTLLANSFINIIEQDNENYYVFEKNLCFKKKFIDELIEKGTLVPFN